MNKTSLIVFNFSVFLIMLWICIALQTSLLPLMLGPRVTIQMALVLITYVCLSREPMEALLFTVISTFSLGLFSTMLESIAIFTGIFLFLALRTLKSLAYSPTPVYFVWTSLAAIFSFHFISWITIAIFDYNAPSPRPLHWLLELLVTALFIRLLYMFFIWVDKRTKRLADPEFLL